MFKNIIYLFIVSLLVFSSCKSRVRRIWHRASISQGDGSEPSARDRSITKANAYNNIFLDSLAFEKYVTTNVQNDSISLNMRDFYNVRNFEYAWFDSNGLTEQALGFRSLFKYNTDSLNKQLDSRLDELLLRESSIDPTDPSIVKLELQLSRRFVQFLLDADKDDNLNVRDLETFIPIKKQPMLKLADSILSVKNKDNVKYAAINPLYHSLKGQLANYITIAKKGGWDTIPSTKSTFVLGKNFPELLKIKSRLRATGEFAVNDTTATYTPELAAAIKIFQSAHGISPDGKISSLLIRSMNVPVLERIAQILVNMERMRWMPTKKEGKLIMVNIPQFTLRVTDGNTLVKEMAVVVGKEGHTTTMFSDDLEQIVFSPYWNIPSSIVKKEILPAMQNNSNYLSKKNMEITRKGGGTPEIRQRPGGENSLGRVKFLFPNSFNIYFHDTPSKSLFEKDNRAYSHGCIRLSDPVWMANYLLENSPEWTPEKIEAAMNRGVERFVKLKHSVPVIITYYTAWVDDNKKINFREDIYGNDHTVIGKMFSETF